MQMNLLRKVSLLEFRAASSSDAVKPTPCARIGFGRAGEAMEVSADPLKDELQAQLKGIVWNDPKSYAGQLRPILANASIFGSDLTATPLAAKIEGYFVRLLEGPGSARRLLQAELA